MTYIKMRLFTSSQLIVSPGSEWMRCLWDIHIGIYTNKKCQALDPEASCSMADPDCLVARFPFCRRLWNQTLTTLGSRFTASAIRLTFPALKTLCFLKFRLQEISHLSGDWSAFFSRTYLESISSWVDVLRVMFHSNWIETNRKIHPRNVLTPSFSTSPPGFSSICS